MTRRSRPPGFPASIDALRATAPQGRSVTRPQPTVDAAARAAAHAAVPGGVGLDSAQVRGRLVARLRAAGLDCSPVLEAMSSVARHGFVDSALAAQAYEDTSLPIGHGQTISKPSVVARMLGLLFDSQTAGSRGDLGRVLEIGTGCGYQTALLARLSRRVVSVERIRPLHERAAVNLAAHREGDRIRLVWGDGSLGHPPLAPYDHIVAAAGGDAVPDAWFEQLAVGGRLVAPVSDATGRSQSLIVVDRHPGGLRQRRLEGVWFVPLKSGQE